MLGLHLAVDKENAFPLFPHVVRDIAEKVGFANACPALHDPQISVLQPKRYAIKAIDTSGGSSDD
jgi:hypothetical protein